MKKVLLFLLLLFFILGVALYIRYQPKFSSKTILSSLFYKKSTFVDRSISGFVLGIDNYKSIINKLDFYKIDIYEEWNNSIKLVIITYATNEINAKIVFTLINDVLYSVKYYPSEKKIDNYIEMLNDRYYVCYPDSMTKEWFNKYIVVKFDKKDSSFIYYDSELLEKYTQYEIY